MTAEPGKFDLNDFDAIVWDWDGVIFDSLAAIAKSAVELCALHGVQIDEAYYNNNFSQPWEKFYTGLGIEFSNNEERQNFADAYWQIYEKKRLTASLFPDAPDALKALQGKIKMGIVSATRPHIIVQNLQSYGLENIFSPDDIYSLRPDKVGEIKEFYNKYSLVPERVVMIGDLPSDIEHGKQAGVRTAGMARYPENEARLLRSDPDFIFYSLKDLFN